MCRRRSFTAAAASPTEILDASFRGTTPLLKQEGRLRHSAKRTRNCPTGCKMIGCGAHKHLISGDCLRLLKRAHSPPFLRRGGCASIKRSRSSAAQTGWLVNSNKNKVRYADIN